MKNQKFVIISVVVSILFAAILGTIILLDMNVSANSCNHTWGEWVDTGVGYHYRICTKDCGASEGQACDDYSSWVAHDGETHRWVCSVCKSFTKPRNHNFVNGVCEDCGYLGIAEPGCNHGAWILGWDSNYHWNQCLQCGEELFGRTGHTYVNGVCTGCDYACNHPGYYNGACVKCGNAEPGCSHSSWKMMHNEYVHWGECLGCHIELFVREPHTLVNGACTACTYKCEHNVKVWRTTESEHVQICNDCKVEIAGTKGKHIYKNGACTTCTYTCKHSGLKWLATSTEHWKVCKVCEVEIAGTRDNHTFENGRCKECNYTCKHEKTEWKNSETEHWQVCENCGDEIDGTRKTHTYEDGECTDCSKEQVKDSENENQNPTDTENKDDNTNNNDNTNKDENTNNNDNTNKDENVNDNDSTNKEEDKNNNDNANKDENTNNNDDNTNKDEDVNNNDNTNKDEDTNNNDNANKDEDTSNKDNDTADKEDTTIKDDKIPDTGFEENMQIAVMMALAVIGSAVLINLSREED